MSTTGYTVQPYDHGFPRPHLARHFDDLDEALTFCAQQRGGRSTTAAGRVISDITWKVQDDATGDLYRPDPEHYEAIEAGRPDRDRIYRHADGNYVE